MTIFTYFSRTVLTVFFTLTFTASFAMAQVVNIPDANLRARIEVVLNKDPGDAITEADMQTLTLFSAVNADIRDLTGLEHATNLVWLELDNNAISDITPLTFLTQLAGLYLNNNPLSAESLDRHLPELWGRDVVVSYTLPSDVNSDGIVNIQDMVSVTQYFGGTGDLTADVNKDGIVNITDLTRVAGDIGDTPVNSDATDGVDTAPSETPPRPAAFIFGKFIEQLISDIKEVFSYDDSMLPLMGNVIIKGVTDYKETLSYDESIFQPPGKGFHAPGLGYYSVRPPDWHVLGTFIPDVIRTTSLQHINKFSAEYKLTMAEFMNLLRNLWDARILIVPPEHHVVVMPDPNLRKAIVAIINELGISLGPTNRPKELIDPIYVGEMRKIKYITADAAGIESLVGLEYATNLVVLRLENRLEIIWVEKKINGVIASRYKVPKPPTPNRISDLTPLENLTNLTILHLQCNAVSDPTPLRNLRNLKWLSLEENKVTDIAPLADLTNLEQLYLHNHYYSPEWAGDNRISDLTPLENLTNLTILDLGLNGVSNLFPLRNLRNLRGLSLEENKITDIAPLADLTNLERLYLRNHNYSSQDAGDNEITSLAPLLNLTKLETLYVDHNPIGSSIGIVRNFRKLRHLSIGCCGVSNLRPVLECPGLRGAGSFVYLTHSPITEEDIPDIRALEARGVRIDDGILYKYVQGEDGTYRKVFVKNNVEWCLSLSSRESIRAAPALQSQLPIQPDVLSSVWQDLAQVPEETALMPNYPNPFNPETWIPYQLATPAEVRVAIHAADGRLVRTLALGYQAAGVYQSKGRATYWDGRNALGEPVASGVYFYTLMAGDFTATRKLLIRK